MTIFDPDTVPMLKHWLKYPVGPRRRGKPRLLRWELTEEQVREIVRLLELADASAANGTGLMDKPPLVV